MTRPIASSSKPPVVVWPPVDSGGLVPVLAARRQMVLLCGLARAAYEDPSKGSMPRSTTLELCDRHGIRLVWCLAAGEFTDTRLVPGKGWVFGDEQLHKLVADRNSRKRRLLYRYLDEIVSRYRNRKTVMMWEISNEFDAQRRHRRRASGS